MNVPSPLPAHLPRRRHANDHRNTPTPSLIHLIGRFDLTDPTAPRFSWPGSRITTRFTGTSISVILDDPGLNQFDVFLDGVRLSPPLKLLPGENAYELATNLPPDEHGAPAEHDLSLSRRTESLFGPTRFLGFPGATLLSSPPPYDRLIEIIGDSITCGYGVLAPGPDCPFSPDTESETDAYGSLTACALDAAHAAIAYSGHGVFRNFDGDTADTLPILFDRIIADEPDSVWDFSYTPDVVVINLGTNDFAKGDPGAPYVVAYDELVQKVRAHYADAWIVAVSSPMLGAVARATQTAYLTDVVELAATRGDQRVRFVDLPPQDPRDGFGCDFHPTALTQQKVAAKLATALRAITGW